jgi:hypothetical protein
MNANALSPDSLELRALMQRDRIHRTALELFGKVDEAREQLSLTHNVREHFGIVSFGAAAFSLLSGYVIGAVLTRR